MLAMAGTGTCFLLSFNRISWLFNGVDTNSEPETHLRARHFVLIWTPWMSMVADLIIICDFPMAKQYGPSCIRKSVFLDCLHCACCHYDGLVGKSIIPTAECGKGCAVAEMRADEQVRGNTLSCASVERGESCLYVWVCVWQSPALLSTEQIWMAPPLKYNIWIYCERWY